MGVEFLKKQNSRYQRRRQLLVTTERRQRSIFQSCPPSSMTRVKARLLEERTAKVGEYLWARIVKGGQPVAFRQGSKAIAQIPAALVAPCAAEVRDDGDEFVAEVIDVDQEKRRLDLRLASVKALTCHTD